MFPDKNKMVRSANFFWTTMVVAPGAYLVISSLAVFGKPGVARNPGYVAIVFLGLSIVSVVSIAIIIFTQTTSRSLSWRAGVDPLGYAHEIFLLDSILSEAHSIYGVVLTLLSGSIAYGVGFTAIAWACLIWVRRTFRRKLGSLPDKAFPEETD